LLAGCLAVAIGCGACAKSARETEPEAKDRISIAAAARALGAKVVISRKQVVLEGNGRRAVIAKGTREMTIDGVRVLLGDAVEEAHRTTSLSRIDYERRLRPLWSSKLAGPAPRAPHIVVIDAGHGGWDPGTQNKALKVPEKDLTLDVALRLRPLLEAKGWTVVLTRDKDEALAPAKVADLDARAAVATASGADVFLSIHFDADASGALRGSEIFTFAPAHQFATDDYERGQGGGASGNDVMDNEVPANRYDAWNTVLAHALYTRLQPALNTVDLGERIAHFRVLANLPCPGVLVEPAYISNPMEALRAYSPAFRQQVAEALANGLAAYAEEVGSLRR
jgi:N-acetylmuramoyl-L-alanine amidase